MKPVLFKTLGELEKGYGIEFNETKGRAALPGPVRVLRSRTACAKAQRQGTAGRPCAIGVHVSGQLWEMWEGGW